MSITGLLLGLINICLIVAFLVLVGYIAMWLFARLEFPIPDTVQKIYMVIVALIALYLIAALLLGAPAFRVIGESQVPPIHATIAAPPSIIANSKR